MAEPVVTNLAVAAAAHAIMGAQNANDDEPERHEATLLARVALEAGAAEIIAAARELLVAETADDVTAITQETVLEAVAISTARIAALEQLAAEILATFHRTEGGHRARVGQVQIQKWHARLNPAEPWNPGGHPDWRPARG